MLQRNTSTQLQGRPLGDGLDDQHRELEDSLAWVVDALLDGNVDTSAAFFALDRRTQFLAVQVMRTAARAGLDLAPAQSADVVAAVAHAYRRCLTPPSAGRSQGG